MAKDTPPPAAKPIAVPPPKPSRVLVIHTAFIGDIVLATPVLEALRTLLPAADILFVTTPAGAKVLEPNPWGVRVRAFHKRGPERGARGLYRLGKELRAWNPELTFCLHRSFRSSLLSRLAGGDSWGFREAAGAFLFKHRVSRDGFEFEADKNLALISAWSGVKGFSRFPRLRAASADNAAAASLLEGVGKFVAMAPSSVWATKRWPAERFGRLAERLQREHGLRTVVVGSDAPEDIAAAAALMAASGAARPLNLCGKTSLGALKSVLSRAELVVSNDSSPLHMGIAAERPVVGIFGPTTRELGFFPLVSCRPCGKHGHDRCPLGHFRCMLDLTEESVYQEISKLLCP
ncbi:MAG: glycosyltransferase family 9 protein [Proteobacteria bacterium]|nr:MAG: glycosyltransferase family 9 protein [Pseudomonadota bacterium]